MASERIELDHLPGADITVVHPDGERRYVALDVHTDDLRRKVLASVRHTVAGSRREVNLGSNLRIGYSFWGFLGDYKLDEKGQPMSTPDGNATYSYALIWECVRRGHTVLPMMPDRDRPGSSKWGEQNFSAFSKEKRVAAYGHVRMTGDMFRSRDCAEDSDFPELDLLLLEWRFPIAGRNTPDMVGKPGYQPDLTRQRELLRVYRERGTPIVVWDLDYKLTDEEMAEWGIDPSRVIETSTTAHERGRVSIEPPCVVEDLLQLEDLTYNSITLAYIGSRYERDDVIDEWIRPIANRNDMRREIHFYGNWMRDVDELRVRWPGVHFHDRVTTKDFGNIYAAAGGVPLLAKREYMERGFITPRPAEALMFGSVPIGLKGHRDIERYTPFVAKDPEDLARIGRALKYATPSSRKAAREAVASRLQRTDASFLVDILEGMV
jgi:hypothetical protein